jgi:hypothetical protein
MNAPEGLRALLSLLGRLVSSPAVRDALRRADPSLLLHAERVWRQWHAAFKAERTPADDPEEHASRVSAARSIAARVCAHPGGFAPREG